MIRSTRFILLAAAALLAAACGRFAHLGATLAYANATPLITWTVDDYFDLSRAQKDAVRAEVAQAMAWHREHELPQYDRFLASVARRAVRPFSEAEVAEAWGELRSDYDRAVEHVLPQAAGFLAQLDERQLTHLQQKFDDEDRKFEKEQSKGTEAERGARDAKRVAALVEDWTGQLDESQPLIVDARQAAVPSILPERLAERRYRQQQTIALARSHDPARIAAGLRRILIDMDSWRRPEYREKLRQRDEATFRMIARLSATLTPRQRTHLRERIEAYMTDIARLAHER